MQHAPPRNATVESTEHGLPRRRIVVAAGGGVGAVSAAGGGGAPSSPQQQQRHQWQDNELKDHPVTRRRHGISILRHTFKRPKWSMPLLLAVIASASVLLRILWGRVEIQIPPTALRCSSLGGILRSSFSYRSQSQSRQSPPSIILVASHLRHGSDGQMRLRIIEHNLRMLSLSSSYGVHDSLERDKHKPFKCILIFSLEGDKNSAISDMVDVWRNGTVSTNAATAGMITNVLYVPNDAVLVDASKWMRALYDILPEIRRTDARVMLINDSFLLTRGTPELWDGACGDVCGLVWTADESNPSRHIQSYMRTLSSCAVERYMAFYEQSKGRVHNVNELIVLFEINLDWARRGKGLRLGGGSKGSRMDTDVSAIYDYAGAHPDEEKAQKVLMSQGYPAIKLKKFFVTDDPWLSMNETSRPQLPPSFSTAIYKRANHDLNHLSDSDLQRHFIMSGKNEDRIYSGTLPLVMKDWLREELINMNGGREGKDRRRRKGSGEEGESIIDILEDYLAALNRDIIGVNNKQ
jgi:hypothetical protein